MSNLSNKSSNDWTLVIDGSTKWWAINLRDLLSFRYLLFLFVRRDFVALYKQTILGPMWFVVQPVLMTLVFSVIFGNIAGLSPEGVPTFLFYLSGITAWTYFADCVNKTSATFTKNVNIFSKVYFPRLLVPISIVISNIVKFIVQYALFMIFLTYYIMDGSSVQPNLWVLATPLLLLIMAGMGLGFGLIVSALTTKYRDLQNLVAFGVQLMMFMTPVVYPLSRLPENLMAIAIYNPMTPVVELFRYAYLGNGTFTIWGLGYSVGVTVVLLLVGMLIFGRIEKELHRHRIVSKVIQIEDLSKQYRLGLVGTNSLSHDFHRWLARIRGKEDPFLKIGEENVRSEAGESDYVWALRNINLEVNQGEVVGIIGKNGAGKSTLLKILSRVTGPTVGKLKVKGRIASLLEVGTGFHPELTGKENVFLNGAILGMTRQEVLSKFDEIIDFAGVERYIDTPVKRYSSGMYVRLAFAVAAHLEPEILVVDEVLSVGDIEFQKKCLGKMQDVARGGRTILFVSHVLPSIEHLCSRCILIENGQKGFDGDVTECLNRYLASHHTEGNTLVSELTVKNKQIEIEKIEVNGSESSNLNLSTEDRKLNIRIEGQLKTEMSLYAEARIFDNKGQCLAFYTPKFFREQFASQAPGRFAFEENVELPLMNQGEFFMSLYIMDYRNINVSLAHFEKALKIIADGATSVTGWTFKFNRGNGWMVLKEANV